MTLQHDLDATDRQILTVLQREGRISNADLAERVALSASACHRRVQRLESKHYVDAYVALLNRHLAGCPTTVFIEVTLSGQALEILDAFEHHVVKVPNVLECHLLMSGTADYLLKVVVADAEDFARFHRACLTRLPGVARMQSSFSLRTVRQTTAVPL